MTATLSRLECRHACRWRTAASEAVLHVQAVCRRDGYFAKSSRGEVAFNAVRPLHLAYSWQWLSLASC